MDDTELQKAKEEALAYNRTLIPGVADNLSFSEEALKSAAENYENLLNIRGDGIMGYVEIPKIDVNLPIYHGTGDDSLDRGVGHLLGSSLPVGGETSHAVLTAHSGLAGQRLFSDLDKLECGDTFYVHTLDETIDCTAVSAARDTSAAHGATATEASASSGAVSAGWTMATSTATTPQRWMRNRCTEPYLQL